MEGQVVKTGGKPVSESKKGLSRGELMVGDSGLRLVRKPMKFSTYEITPGEM
jgi:hypothetical protein